MEQPVRSASCSQETVIGHLCLTRLPHHPSALWPTENLEEKAGDASALLFKEEACQLQLEMNDAQNDLGHLFTLPPRMCLCGSHEGWGGQTPPHKELLKPLCVSKVCLPLEPGGAAGSSLSTPTVPAPHQPASRHTCTFLCPLNPLTPGSPAPTLSKPGVVP